MITRLLMKKEVANLFGVTVKAVDKWVSEQKIPFIRISRKCIRFDERVIEKFLAKRTVKDRVRPSLKTRQREKARIEKAAKEKIAREQIKSETIKGEQIKSETIKREAVVEKTGSVQKGAGLSGKTKD
jgi:excisionase family DNA binding protein